uniref:Uncharacterized protein n=1 Tax=Magallana gigas TaxID=29159 RepID=K1PU40_MAGGI
MSSGIEACLNVSRFFFEVFRKTHAVPLQKHAKGDNVMELLKENNDVIMTSNNLGLLFRFSSLQIVCNAEDSNINPHNLKIDLKYTVYINFPPECVCTNSVGGDAED